MGHLEKSDFTKRTVFNPTMTKKGGGVGPGVYERRGKNLVLSSRVKARWNRVAREMTKSCKSSAHFTGNRETVGKLAKDGTAYTFNPQGAIENLKAAWACASRHMKERRGARFDLDDQGEAYPPAPARGRGYGQQDFQSRLEQIRAKYDNTGDRF